jgi:hypothetical protein
MDQLLIIELLFFKEYIELESYITRLVQNYDVIMQNLFRRDFIKLYNTNISGYKHVRNIYLSLKGENVIKTLRDVKFEEGDGEIIITVETYFNEFWDTFPASDKNPPFPPTRSLKADKNGCNKKYVKLLMEEGYKHEEIIEALKFQIALFKKNSTMVENKMKYFQNSSTWLNQKTFLEYQELAKSENIENESRGLIL